MVCGLLLVVVLLCALVPLVDAFDDAVLSHPVAPLLLLGLTVAMVAAYPATATWNPARWSTLLYFMLINLILLIIKCNSSYL